MIFNGRKTDRIPLGGVNEAWGEEPPAALSIVDMRWSPEGYWYNMPGYVRVDSDSTGVDGDVLWCRWFSPRGNRERYFMVEVAVTDSTSKLGYIDLSDGSFVSIQTGRRRSRHPWQGLESLEHNGWLYLHDGVNQWVRWAPDQGIRPVGFSSVPGPMVAVSGDSDGGIAPYDWSGGVSISTVSGEQVSDGYPQQRGVGSTTPDERFEYVYAFTTINEFGQESPASTLAYASGATAPDSDADGVGARRGVFFTVPRQPETVRQVRVWRSRNQQDVIPVGRPPLYLLTTAYHAAGFEYLDFAPDGELGEQLDEDNLGSVPVGVKSACMWSETMFVIGQDETTVYYSAPGLVEQFPLDNALPMATETSGPLTSIHAAPRGVIVFAERAVFIIKATPDLRFYGQPLLKGVGSLSGRAVVEIPRVGFAFLDEHAGPMAIVGSLDDDTTTNIVPIASEVRRKWVRRVNREALSQARASIDPESREVWWHVPEGGAQKQTLGIVYHYGINGWSFREGWPIGDLDYDRGYTWFGGHEDLEGVYVLTPHATDKAGTAFSCTYETQWMQFVERNMILRAYWWVIGTGDGELQVSTRIERRQDWVAQYEGDAPTTMPTECDLDQWGSAVWSTTETFVEHMPTVIPVSINPEVALEHQIRVVSPATTDLRVIALQLEIPGSSYNPAFEEG